MEPDQQTCHLGQQGRPVVPAGEDLLELGHRYGGLGFAQLASVRMALCRAGQAGHDQAVSSETILIHSARIELGYDRSKLPGQYSRERRIIAHGPADQPQSLSVIGTPTRQVPDPPCRIRAPQSPGAGINSCIHISQFWRAPPEGQHKATDAAQVPVRAYHSQVRSMCRWSRAAPSASWQRSP